MRRRCLEGWGAAQRLLLKSSQNGVCSPAVGGGNQILEGVLRVAGSIEGNHGEEGARSLEGEQRHGCGGRGQKVAAGSMAMTNAALGRGNADGIHGLGAAEQWLSARREGSAADDVGLAGS